MTRGPRDRRLLFLRTCLVMCCASAMPASAGAQIEITELMINPEGSDQSVWEWIEVRNAGGEAIDLDGYIVNKRNFAQDAAITITVPGGAVIQANNGVAVLYNGAAEGADDQLFRTAWSLPPSANIYSVPNLPTLANSGDNRNIGFWANDADYMADWVDVGEEGFDVGSFNNAAFSIDYASEGFEGVNSGVSITWDGNGDYRAGSNWDDSVDGVAGSVVSTQVFRSAVPINNVDDAGSPGIVPTGGTPKEGLLITEIMYDPASADSDWEWVEIYNNTVSAIDFAATPYIFDDMAGSALSEPNVDEGTVGQGEVAVLYDSSLSAETVQAAWDPGGANGTNFIAVARWPALNNGGDVIGLWDDLTAYDSDSAGDDRVTDGAAGSIAYDNATDENGDPSGWPSNGDGGSIYLQGLDRTASDGTNWRMSLADEGDAFAAAEVLEVAEANPGGEVGSPGFFGDAPPTPAADFDGDLAVDGADLDIWEGSFGGSADQTTGDATGDALATGDDFLLLQRQYTGSPSAASVPEPSAVGLALLASLAALAGRRQRL